MVLMNHGNKAIPSPPPPAPKAPLVNVWNVNGASHSNKGIGGGGAGAHERMVHYHMQQQWRWVMESNLAHLQADDLKQVETPLELPTVKLAAAEASSTPTSTTPASRRRRTQRKAKNNAPATFRVEVSDMTTGRILMAVHGTSSALDGMEDKDELVRTIQRCRCEQLHLSPPSLLISWDVTHEECLNVVGKDLPSIEGNTSSDKVAILKEPMGSRGRGIYFVKNAEDIHKVIDEQHQRALKEPELIDSLIEAKGRIPSWVLQAEVVPCLLIRDRRKFHIRSYLVIIERPFEEELVDLYIFNRHEIRIAGIPVEEDPQDDRNPLAHITNGALCKTTDRILLHQEPELQKRGLQEKVENFIAQTFAQHLLPDITRRVRASAITQRPGGHGLSPPVRQFALAGLDLMVTEQDRLYLLELNANPTAPPVHMVDNVFREHLEGFLQDLVDLVVGQPSPNFLDAFAILENNGLL